MLLFFLQTAVSQYICESDIHGKSFGTHERCFVEVQLVQGTRVSMCAISFRGSLPEQHFVYSTHQSCRRVNLKSCCMMRICVGWWRRKLSTNQVEIIPYEWNMCGIMACWEMSMSCRVRLSGECWWVERGRREILCPRLFVCIHVWFISCMGLGRLVPYSREVQWPLCQWVEEFPQHDHLKQKAMVRSVSSEFLVSYPRLFISFRMLFLEAYWPCKSINCL